MIYISDIKQSAALRGFFATGHRFIAKKWGYGKDPIP